MTINTTKKDTELAILKAALEKARSRGGESRRLADRISGEIIPYESPDFVIRSTRNDTAIIGVEHFRVDHFSERNKKRGHYDSLSSAEQQRMVALQKSWKPDNLNDEIPPWLIEETGLILARCLEAGHKATFHSYIHSFQDAFEKHLGKAEGYLESISESYPYSKKRELAFLIELHSDFSNLFINRGSITSKPQAGEILFFKELENIIAPARMSINYLIIASCPSLTNDVIDACIINMNAFLQSLKRNKLDVYDYFGEDKILDLYPEIHLTPHTSGGREVVNYSFDQAGVRMTDWTMIQLCLNSLPTALRLRDSKVPFVNTAIVQMLLEVFGDIYQTCGRKKYLTLKDLIRHRYYLENSYQERADAFLERWYKHQAANSAESK